MRTSFRLFGTRCMRVEPVAIGPGEVVVVMDRTLRLQGSEASRTITLDPGHILFSDLDADDVASTIHRHLRGKAHDSDLRFGVALILGLKGLMDRAVLVTPEHERLIDAWLDENTVFAVTVYSEDGQRDPDRSQVGVLNGVRTHWHRVKRTGAALH